MSSAVTLERPATGEVARPGSPIVERDLPTESRTTIADAGRDCFDEYVTTVVAWIEAGT